MLNTFIMRFPVQRKNSTKHGNAKIKKLRVEFLGRSNHPNRL